MEQIPWKRLSPDQATQLFHRVQAYEDAFARHVSLEGFSAQDLAELLEGANPKVYNGLLPELKKVLSKASFTMEELELLADIPRGGKLILPELANPPSDYDAHKALGEFRDVSQQVREILFFSCRSADFFPELFLEAWAVDPGFVKAHAKALSPAEIGPFFRAVAGTAQPRVVEETGKKAASLQFDRAELNSLFASLPVTRKRAAVKFFSP